MRWPVLVSLLLWVVCAQLVSAQQAPDAPAEQAAWPCTTDVEVLRDDRGQAVWLDSRHLEKRATHKVPMEFPVGVDAEGSVTVDLLIGREGDVRCAKAERGHPIVRRSAEDAARRWKFRPVVINKRSYAVFGRLTLKFSWKDTAPKTE